MATQEPARPVGRPPKVIGPIPAPFREVIQSLVKLVPKSDS